MWFCPETQARLGPGFEGAHTWGGQQRQQCWGNGLAIGFLFLLCVAMQTVYCFYK